MNSHAGIERSTALSLPLCDAGRSAVAHDNLDLSPRDAVTRQTIQS